MRASGLNQHATGSRRNWSTVSSHTQICAAKVSSVPFNFSPSSSLKVSFFVEPTVSVYYDNILTLFFLHLPTLKLQRSLLKTSLTVLSLNLKEVAYKKMIYCRFMGSEWRTGSYIRVLVESIHHQRLLVCRDILLRRIRGHSCPPGVWESIVRFLYDWRSCIFRLYHCQRYGIAR